MMRKKDLWNTIIGDMGYVSLQRLLTQSVKKFGVPTETVGTGRRVVWFY